LARKHPDDKRTKSLHVKLTSAQREAIDRAARRDTLDPSVWARMVLLRSTDWNPDDG